jgi:hypothetical protein
MARYARGGKGVDQTIGAFLIEAMHPVAQRLTIHATDSRYRSGRCREWIKVKNRAHPVAHYDRLLSHQPSTIFLCPELDAD